MSQPKYESKEKEKASFVHVSDYNNLREKYLKKVQENKNLKDYLDKFLTSFESIKETKKQTENMFYTIKESLNGLMSSQNKPKEEFATSTSSCEFIRTNKRTSSTHASHRDNNILIKKADEIELNYAELVKGFQLLVTKYKLVKEERDKFEENNIKLLEKIANVNREYNKLVEDYNKSQINIDWLTEINKCLIENAYNTTFLNTREHQKSSDNSSTSTMQNNAQNQRPIPYVTCEPVPSFVKFLEKFTK